MNSKLKTPAVEQLFDAILSLENKEECAAFFEDLCTINELLSLSQRFEVAKMLREKKTYLEEGKEAVEMKPGDCINIPAEVKHWHGAGWVED